tara:strand:- start:780 stop:968 length:189 start_codon:yes stop_codon:yes gene_type:complete
METIFGGFDITTMILLFGIWGILYNQGKIAKHFDKFEEDKINTMRETLERIENKLDLMDHKI